MRTVDPVKHEARRRHILNAAAECFATKGFNDTRTADICAAAGISSGNLFHYFPNKQAIFTAIFEQDSQDSAAAIESALAAEKPLEGLFGLVGYVTEQAAYPHLAGFMMEVIANAKRDEAFAVLLDRIDRAMHDGIVTLLSRAQQAGEIDPALAPNVAADWIQLLIDGVFSRASADAEFQNTNQQPMLRRIITRFLAAEA